MIVKDSMVLIHLAKLSLLEKSCDYLKEVIIPESVYKEIGKGVDTDLPVILSLIEDGRISVKKVKNLELIKKVNQLNIQRGEAEVIALYWQEKADIVATDDDNVRKKSILLNISIIGTPAIILKLYKEKMISENKLEQSMSELRKIGWFSNSVIDKIIMEAKNE